jgi:hypothetical protein
MEHPAIEPMSKALYDDRSLVRHHAMRRTLWVFTPENARLAHAACTGSLIATERRRLEQMLADNAVADDVSAWLDQATEDTVAALAEFGPLPARKLGQAVPALTAPLQLAPGKSYAATVQAHTRVLLLLGFEGRLVRTRPTGTWINSEYRWAPMDGWLEGGVTGADPVDAATELARRWLRAFGPATADDLRWWMGWAVVTTKRALARTGVEEVDLDGQTGLILPEDNRPTKDAPPWVALLPGLDPTTMGWKHRDWYLDPAFASTLFDRNGNAGPTVWVDGEIVGGWVQRRTGEIAFRLLADVGRERREDIDAAADNLAKLLADVRVSVRFPAPLQRELLA